MTDVNSYSDNFSKAISDAIEHAVTQSPRTLQQYEERRIGVSNLGHCREYARRLITGEPFTDHRDKTAAFFGTVMGGRIEQELALLHPGWIFQQEVTFRLPSGGEMDGHPDIIIPHSAATPEWPQGVGDLKGKDGLEAVKRYGQNQQQRFQVHAYAKALIDAGVLNPEEPVYVWDAYYDRTGRVGEPYVIIEEYDPAAIDEIDDWVGDVIYAVRHGQEASKDPTRDFCMAWCEFATGCRGLDTDVSGLIEDPEVVNAAEEYADALAMEGRAKKIKTRASIVLGRGAPDGGATDTGVTVRWTEVNGGPVSYYRSTYRKLEVKRLNNKKEEVMPDET